MIVRLHRSRRAGRLAALARRLRSDRSGVSILELALVLPVMLTLGLYGTEVAYMSTVDMEVGQIATALADNASRLGQTDNSAVTPTVTETMIDSVMTGALSQGAGIKIEPHGKIILSSLERDTATGRQYIHWQRCRGSYKAASKYGKAGTGLTGATLKGLGKANITATANSAVMFVEVYYQYQPLFGSMFVGTPLFRREAAFLIRDERNLTPGVTGTGGQSACT